jgi:hypothetical protein
MMDVRLLAWELTRGAALRPAATVCGNRNPHLGMRCVLSPGHGLRHNGWHHAGSGSAVISWDSAPLEPVKA